MHRGSAALLTVPVLRGEPPSTRNPRTGLRSSRNRSTLSGCGSCLQGPRASRSSPIASQASVKVADEVKACWLPRPPQRPGGSSPSPTVGKRDDHHRDEALDRSPVIARDTREPLGHSSRDRAPFGGIEQIGDAPLSPQEETGFAAPPPYTQSLRAGQVVRSLRAKIEKRASKSVGYVHRLRICQHPQSAPPLIPRRLARRSSPRSQAR